MIIGLILFIVTFSVIAFIRYRKLKVEQQARQQQELRFERIKLLVDKFHQGQIPAVEEVFPFAAHLGSREATYELLNERGRLDLFPEEFLSIVKSAEAHLAVWLEFPTELDALPDEIEHVKRVTVPFDKENNVHYEVFRFRVNEPHWGAKNGWTLGVVGPFFDDSNPYDFPRSTFSRFNSQEGTITPEDEVKWVHQNLSMRG